MAINTSNHHKTPQFVEVFPIKTSALPPLTAYTLRLTGELTPSEKNKLGSRLAAKLRGTFTGYWLWASGRLIVDTPPQSMKLLIALDQLRAEQPNLFGWIDAFEEDYAWAATAEAMTDYVIRGPLASLEPQINDLLAKTAYGIKNTLVEREHRVRMWEVDGQAAISIAVVSRLLYEPQLQDYANTLKDPDELIGLWAADTTSTASGEIIKIVGTMKENRSRLLAVAKRDLIHELISAAPDDALVIRLQIGYQDYDFPSNALRLLIHVDDAEKFNIKQQMVERALSLKPTMRAEMIKLVSDIVKNANLIDKSYRSTDQAHLFINSQPEAILEFGAGKTRELAPEKLPRDFLALGAHTKQPQFESKPIQIVVINTLVEEVSDFLEALKRAMKREYNFEIDIIRERKVRVPTQANLESAVRLLAKENADLAVVFLEDEQNNEDDESVSARYARTQTIGRGLPCLIIHEGTMHKPETMPDIVMGLIARAGNIPYLLHEPLRYADRVVGLSLVRQSKRDGDYIIGITRIYQNNGALLKAFVAGSLVKAGEGIPDDLLTKLLPASLLRKQRVILHHDGKLKREVLWAIQAWEEGANATLYPVEIVRRGIPRLYNFKGGKPESPEWGSTFRISDLEAFLVTSFSTGDVTPQPLHIRAEPPLTVEQAIHSVMSFSLFHYGALQQPKLPVTIHHADLLDISLGRGVMPTPFETTVPFWL